MKRNEKWEAIDRIAGDCKMIDLDCACGTKRSLSEHVGERWHTCDACKTVMHVAVAEKLDHGAGTGDFDARLVVRAGPERAGHNILLGGVSDLHVGKLEDKHVQLRGPKVSRYHCVLRRLDYGPSRWEIVDQKSTNGLFVNGERVDSRELQHGDAVQIGDYQLEFRSTFVAPKISAAERPLTCPSCARIFKAQSKICVDCGIYIATGKPLITSKAMDENDLAIRTNTWVRICSIFIPFGLFPVASEAFGTKKPVAIWSIFGITVLASILFYAAKLESPQDPTVLNWMLWTGNAHVSLTDDPSLQRLIERSGDAGKQQALRQMIQKMVQQRVTGQYHTYQLLTNTLLHSGVMHLAGNMLFLLVFGLRVNELIGNWKTAIIYPLLGVLASISELYAMRNGPLMPALGASGAIMGLAGMYFVLFPVQKVVMVVWLRLGMFTGWRVFYKLFRMRGFWLLGLWVGLNDVLPVAFHLRDHTAHWAHLGGFICGMAIALLLLLTRQVHSRGADLLSVSLGRKAWAVLGKPSQWTANSSPALRATVLG